MKLVGNSAVVTGGAQGIGYGCAELLMAHGASLVIAGTNYDRAQKAASQLGRKYEGKVVPVRCDVTSASDVKQMVDAAVSELGGVSILVNNAGIAAVTRTWEIAEEEWDQVVDVSLKGTFLCTREVLNRMIPANSGGAIVNISSINYMAATDGMSHYSAAKAAVSQFTKAVAAEVGRYGIRVNAVAPGTTRTPLSEAGFLDGKMGEEFLVRTPLGRYGEPVDVAKVVVFLASDYAGWVTGATIPVDGGQHIRGLHSYWDVMHEQAGG